MLLTSLLLALTVPGIAETYSVYLGNFGLKVLAGGLMAVSLTNLKAMPLSMITIRIVLLMSTLLLFRVLHSSPGSEGIMLLVSSVVWVILTGLYIKTRRDLEILILFIYIASIIVLVSPGLYRIYSLDRVIGLAARSVNGLKGIAYSYIIYAQVVVLSLFLSLRYLVIGNNSLMRLLNAAIFVTSLVSLMTCGSKE